MGEPRTGSREGRHGERGGSIQGGTKARAYDWMGSVELLGGVGEQSGASTGNRNSTGD